MSELKRPFGIWTTGAMVVGTMIGSGIFVLPSKLAPIGWTAVAGWIACGCGVLAVARLLAALIVRFPAQPSILAILGDVLGLLAGRLLAWSYWTATVASAAVLATAAMSYLLRVLPGLPEAPLPRALAGSAIMLALTLNNLRGMRAAGGLQVLTTTLKLLPLVLVVLLVGWLGLTAAPEFGAEQLPPFAWAELTPALGITFFALLGFESAGIVAERVRDPARNVVRATLFGLVGVLAIYLVVSTGVMLSVPTAELAASEAPIALFAERILGSWVGAAVALFAAISAIGCLNGLVVALGELPLGMVRDGQLPEWMAPLNARQVAARPLMLACFLCIALMLGSATGFGERVLDFLLRLTTASAIWFYVGICFAALVTRIMPLLAVAGLLFCGWVLYGTGLEAGGLGLVLLLLGIPIHFLIGGRTHRPLATEPASA